MSSNTRASLIYVLEDNPGDFVLLKESLQQLKFQESEIIHFDTLAALLSFSERSSPDVILLDLNLPDSNGLETFRLVNEHYSTSALIILSGIDDESVSLSAIQAGAQDYLIKGHFSESVLSKTLLYSIERKRGQLTLQDAIQRFEIVSNATNDVIWDWNFKTNEIFWNDKVAIFGYPEDTIKNAHWRHSHIHSDDYTMLSDKLHECIRKQCDHWSHTYRFQCANGELKYILERGYMLFDRKGSVYRMIGSMADITGQIEMQKRIEKEKLLQQEAILRATVEGQEKERNEIGRELHDNVNQMLATVRLCITSAVADPDGEFLLNKAMSVIDECIREVRTLSANLVSLQNRPTGLKGTLEEFIARIQLNRHMVFHVDIDEAALSMLNEQESLTVYRVLQEQTNNIIKHADASEIYIRISHQDDKVKVVIRDNGKGFDQSAVSDGIGLSNMKARANLINAALVIQSRVGKGSSVQLDIPAELALANS